MSGRLGVGAFALVVVVAGCAEQPQTYDASARKIDTPAWATSDTANPAFYAPGWKANGDQAAWLNQINERTQGQNDYTRR